MEETFGKSRVQPEKSRLVYFNAISSPRLRVENRSPDSISEGKVLVGVGVQERNEEAHTLAKILKKMKQDSEKQRLFCIKIITTNGSTKKDVAPDNFPPGHIIKSLNWSQYSPLQQLLLNNRDQFFRLDRNQKGGSKTFKLRVKFNLQLVSLVEQEVKRKGWKFDANIKRENIRIKIRNFYNTQVKNCKLRIKNAIREPTSSRSRDFLFKNRSLILEYDSDWFIYDHTNGKGGGEFESGQKEKESQKDGESIVPIKEEDTNNHKEIEVNDDELQMVEELFRECDSNVEQFE